jgi:hypothetical protein
MITYQIESWDIYRGEALGLWQQHWDAVATDKSQMEMSPQEIYYAALYSAEALQIMTVRENGRMIGYCLVVVRPHMHYSKVLCGFEDSYFVEPRKGLATGIVYARLVKKSLEALKARGVKKVFFHSKSFALLERIFLSQGFAQSDVVYSKWIGE